MENLIVEIYKKGSNVAIETIVISLPILIYSLNLNAYKINVPLSLKSVYLLLNCFINEPNSEETVVEPNLNIFKSGYITVTLQLIVDSFAKHQKASISQHRR